MKKRARISSVILVLLIFAIAVFYPTISNRTDAKAANNHISVVNTSEGDMLDSTYTARTFSEWSDKTYNSLNFYETDKTDSSNYVIAAFKQFLTENPNMYKTTFTNVTLSTSMVNSLNGKGYYLAFLDSSGNQLGSTMVIDGATNYHITGIKKDDINSVIYGTLNSNGTTIDSKGTIISSSAKNNYLDNKIRIIFNMPDYFNDIMFYCKYVTIDEVIANRSNLDSLVLQQDFEYGSYPMECYFDTLYNQNSELLMLGDVESHIVTEIGSVTKGTTAIDITECEFSDTAVSQGAARSAVYFTKSDFDTEDGEYDLESKRVLVIYGKDSDGNYLGVYHTSNSDPTECKGKNLDEMLEEGRYYNLFIIGIKPITDVSLTVDTDNIDVLSTSDANLYKLRSKVTEVTSNLITVDTNTDYEVIFNGTRDDNGYIFGSGSSNSSVTISADTNYTQTIILRPNSGSFSSDGNNAFNGNVIISNNGKSFNDITTEIYTSATVATEIEAINNGVSKALKEGDLKITINFTSEAGELSLYIPSSAVFLTGMAQDIRNISYKVDGVDASAIQSVSIDDVDVDSANYTVTDSDDDDTYAIVSFTDSYKETISVDRHKVKITYDGGSIEKTINTPLIYTLPCTDVSDVTEVTLGSAVLDSSNNEYAVKDYSGVIYLLISADSINNLGSGNNTLSVKLKDKSGEIVTRTETISTVGSYSKVMFNTSMNISTVEGNNETLCYLTPTKGDISDDMFKVSSAYGYKVNGYKVYDSNGVEATEFKVGEKYTAICDVHLDNSNYGFASEIDGSNNFIQGEYGTTFSGYVMEGSSTRYVANAYVVNSASLDYVNSKLPSAVTGDLIIEFDIYVKTGDITVLSGDTNFCVYNSPGDLVISVPVYEGTTIESVYVKSDGKSTVKEELKKKATIDLTTDPTKAKITIEKAILNEFNAIGSYTLTVTTSFMDMEDTKELSLSVSNNTYYITFKFWDGKDDIVLKTNETQTYGDVINSVTTLNGNSTANIDTYREGYGFEGWYTTSDFTTKINEDKDVDGDKTLYGMWVACDYEPVEYVWSTSYATCTAYRECINYPKHSDYEQVQTTSKKVDATYDSEGSITYTATFTSPAFETQTHVETIEKLSLKYKEVTYTWSDDLTTCTAFKECSTKDENGQYMTKYDIKETVDTYVKTTAATVASDGSVEYKAVFKNDAFSDQIKTTVLKKLEATYKAPTYTWSEDHLKCTAYAECEQDKFYSVKETVVTAVSKKNATYEEDGSATYTATFKSNLLKKQTYTETLPKLTLSYKEVTYNWNKDYTTCTAYKECVESPTYDETEVATAVVTTVAATYEKEGATVYTATFTNKSFKTQVHSDPIAQLEKTYQSPTYTWGANHLTCTALLKCNESDKYDITEKVYSSVVTYPETSEEVGRNVYTAVFTNIKFSTQVYKEKLSDSDRSYGEATYTWSSDYSTCLAVKECSLGASYSITEKVNSVMAEINGQFVYTAKFTNSNFETQTFTLGIDSVYVSDTTNESYVEYEEMISEEEEEEAKDEKKSKDDSSKEKKEWDGIGLDGPIVYVALAGVVALGGGGGYLAIRGIRRKKTGNK